MDFANILSTAGTIAAVLAVASVLRQRDTISTLKENNLALQERVVLLEEETKSCLENHLENEKKLHALQAELTAYKELTLVPKELVTQLLAKDEEIITLLKEK
jgi:hypothetical protein